MKLRQLHARPILVTGAHRSGTSWVGKILSESSDVALINEPINPANQRAGICAAHFSRYFTYITPEFDEIYADAFGSMLNFEFQYAAALRAIRTPKDIAKAVRDAIRFRTAGRKSPRALVKDATALFAADWLADRFGADIVIMVRHPAAFAGSLKRMNWLADFRDFLEQPALMRDHLQAFEQELNDAVASPLDLIGQAILLWRMFYYTVNRYRAEYPGWLIVRHEDLSTNPPDQFREMFRLLDLDYTAEINQAVVESSSGGIIGAEDQRTHVLKRDTKANIKSWKKRLSEVEVARIREGTSDVAPLFYADEDW